MKLHYAIVLLLASVSTLSAQTVPPALMVQQDGRLVPLGLAELHTEVRNHLVSQVLEMWTTGTRTAIGWDVPRRGDAAGVPGRPLPQFHSARSYGRIGMPRPKTPTHRCSAGCNSSWQTVRS